MAQETIFIDFQVDYEQLTTAQEQLAKSGKIDTKWFKAVQDAIDNTAADTKGLIKQFKDVAGASVKMGKTIEDAFGAGIQDALDSAGVSADEFADALAKANKPAVTIKKELRDLKETMARLKAEGKDTGKEFEALRQRAGELSDAVADANAEIENAASDTRGFDNVIGSVTALAGGFSAVQGAAALFGDESEDLQKSLLKVNAAMAIAQGLQQIQNALQKEGAIIKLKDSIATGAQSAAQAVYTAAVGTSTGALRVFRIALLATGIGAVIALLGLAAEAMGLFGSKTDDASTSAKDLADSLQSVNDNLEISLVNIKRNGELQQEYLKQRGAGEETLNQQTLNNIKIQNRVLERSINERLKLLGDEQTVKNQQDAENLLAIRKNTAETIKAGTKQREIADERINGLQQVVDAYRKISDNEFEITLRTEQAKTKAYQDAQKKREELNKKNEEADKKRTADELAELDKRVKAQLNALDKEEEQLRIHFENEQEIINRDKQQKLADEAEFERQRQALRESFIKSSTDAANKARAEAAAKKAADDEETARKINNAQAVIQIANQVAGVLSSLAAAQSARDQQVIAGQQAALNAQIKAGAISAKEAEQRQKKIDELTRRARQRQAEREKKAAVFQAVLAIPQAFIQGLTSAPPPLGAILGGIAAALAAAQAAIIASAPVPKFFRGKKGNYEGPGVVADMGAELVERNGRMFLYTKPTQTYLGAKDKVYTAAETRNIMHNTNISTTIAPPKPERFDYDLLGKSIPKSSISINIDKDFITESVANGLTKNKYLDRRYSSR